MSRIWDPAAGAIAHVPAAVAPSSSIGESIVLPERPQSEPKTRGELLVDNDHPDGW
jgi:hypothetical protein